MDNGLIDGYVEELRRSLRWRRDADDVVDEVSDHLREHATRLVAAGVASGDAQRQTLARFGDLGTVTRSFARAATGDLAVPTRATRAAGIVALGAGLAWGAAIVGAVAGGHTELLTPWTLQRYQTWIGLLVVAAGLTTIAVAGVMLRAGCLRRPAAKAAVVVGGLVTVALLEVGWAVTILMALLGVALLAGLRGRAGPADRIVGPVRVLGAAWPMGAVALVLGDEVYRIGPVDSYGDYPVAWLVPFCVCAAVSAATLAVIGVRLRAERPAEFGRRPGTPIGTSPADGPLVTKARP